MKTVMSSDMSWFNVRTRSRARSIVLSGCSSDPGLRSSPLGETHSDARTPVAEASTSANSRAVNALWAKAIGKNMAANAGSATSAEDLPRGWD